MNEKLEKRDKKLYKDSSLVLKFILLSAIGIFMFFIPVRVNGATTIPLEVAITFLIEKLPHVVKAYAFIVIMIGAIKPFATKTWNTDRVTKFFSFSKLIGAIFTIILFSGHAPEAISRPDHGPFLFDSLAVQVGVLIPIASIFLTFLMDYGFIDFIGQFLKPVMRKIWRTPGRTAVVAVASFMGSTAVGVMMTNDLYKELKYNIREAIIVATSFSTVSISFFVVIAKTANIMELWTEFFFVAFFVTFAVTAITVRIPPLSTKPNTYYKNQEGILEEDIEGNLFKGALNNGLEICKSAGSVFKVCAKNVVDSYELVFATLPNFMSIGLIALIIANYTTIFDFFGYIFYPLTYILRIPEPLLAAKAAFLGLAEMFLPVMLVTEAPLLTRFVLCVMSVSQILMFSTTIPTIVATEIPVSIKDLVIIWLERTILIFILTVPIAHLVLGIWLDKTLLNKKGD